MVKRVLIISRNFPPLWGGMERLNLHLVNELSHSFQICLIAPGGAAKHVQSNVLVGEAPLRPLSRFLVIAMIRAIWRAIYWRPDVVIGGSGLVAPIALIAASLCRARSFVYVHGLDLVVPHPIYRALWRPAMQLLDGVIANSQSTAQLAQSAGIKRERISVVHPGVAIPANVDLEAPQRFRDKYRLSTGPILLSVGRLTTRKGIREFVEDVLPLIATRRPDVQLVVIGDEPTDSLYAEGQSIRSIRDAAKSSGVYENIHFLGKLFGPELAEAYFAADIHVFPVRAIPFDPEGFGMVAIEAAAHGVPTVAYATGGVVDAVGDDVSGKLVSVGDATGFADAVLQLFEKPPSSESVYKFAAQFSWAFFREKIVAAIRSNHAD